MPSFSKSHPWVTFPSPNPQAQLRLFCFPYAGGGASFFRNWPNHLAPEIEVCPIQLPGREDRLLEPSFTQLLPLVHKLVDVIYPYLEKPFCFFGHSIGSLIAFELARQLRQEYAICPLHLFLSGCAAPQLLHRAEEPIHLLPDDALLEQLRNLHGTPESILQNAELMQILLPAIRADYKACETYEYIPGEVLPCSLSVSGGREDEEASPEDLAAWHVHTQNHFTMRLFRGHHFFLQDMQPLFLQQILQDASRYCRPV